MPNQSDINVSGTEAVSGGEVLLSGDTSGERSVKPEVWSLSGADLTILPYWSPLLSDVRCYRKQRRRSAPFKRHFAAPSAGGALCPFHPLAIIAV